jgi:hypothetical protein
LTIADSSFLTIGKAAGTGSLVLILAGCVMLHVRLRNLPSLSLLIALATNALWLAGGQSTLRDVLTPSHARFPTTTTTGNNARGALATLDQAAMAENAVIAGDTLLAFWVALSLALAVACIPRLRKDQGESG